MVADYFYYFDFEHAKGPKLRLPGQAADHRRQRRRQDQHSAAVLREQLHDLAPDHHRHRLQDQDHRRRRQEDPTADLGHRRPGALQDHHADLLQRGDGHHYGLCYQSIESIKKAIIVISNIIHCIYSTFVTGL